MPRRNQRQGGARRRGGRPRGRGGRINPVPRAQNRDRSRSPPLLVRVPQDSDSSSGDDQIQQLPAPAPAPAPAPQPVLDDIQQALTAVNSRLDLLERGNDQRAAQQAVFLPQAPAPPTGTSDHPSGCRRSTTTTKPTATPHSSARNSGLYTISASPAGTL